MDKLINKIHIVRGELFREIREEKAQRERERVTDPEVEKLVQERDLLKERQNEVRRQVDEAARQQTETMRQHNEAMSQLGELSGKISKVERALKKLNAAGDGVDEKDQ